ncbi:protein kinase [Planoprotostelium fungivorum]|uniref:non-specific serine/threonine protein kinase n=1 Tax=Planoprotostelium fungivorum TaxID=1890364 RepID=A0A2P6NWB5_9EUKA|nr:protein kinase [Planoprotostelium fungivorum]
MSNSDRLLVVDNNSLAGQTQLQEDSIVFLKLDRRSHDREVHSSLDQFRLSLRGVHPLSPPSPRNFGSHPASVPEFGPDHFISNLPYQKLGPGYPKLMKSRDMGAAKHIKNLFKSKKVRLEDRYELVGRSLGKGLTAEVLLAKRKEDGRLVALKIFHRTKGQEYEIQLERSLMTKMAHNAMVELIEVIEEKKRTVFVLEYMNQGDLYNYIESNGTPSQAQTAAIMTSILTVLSHLHTRRVAHRDVKLENIMIDRTPEGDITAKLGDYGFAARDDGSGFYTMCGSLPYSAPELVAGKRYNHRVDIWSLGVVLYILLSGTPPFRSDGRRSMTQQIRSGKYEFNETHWAGVSTTARDLVSRMLEVDPGRRITAEEALRHPFLQPQSPQSPSGRDALVASAA